MTISVRPGLELGDCFLLFAWRLLPDVKRWSLKEAPLWPEHLLYYESLLKAQQEGKVRCYMALHDDLPAGVLIVSGREVNIMVSELHRRKGVAKALLRAAQETEECLVAHVVFGNLVAAKLFVSCGFNLIGGEEKEHKACVSFLWKRKEAQNA